MFQCEDTAERQNVIVVAESRTMVVVLRSESRCERRSFAERSVQTDGWTFVQCVRHAPLVQFGLWRSLMLCTNLRSCSDRLERWANDVLRPPYLMSEAGDHFALSW